MVLLNLKKINIFLSAAITLFFSYSCSQEKNERAGPPSGGSGSGNFEIEFPDAANLTLIDFGEETELATNSLPDAATMLSYNRDSAFVLLDNLGGLKALGKSTELTKSAESGKQVFSPHANMYWTIEGDNLTVSDLADLTKATKKFQLSKGLSDKAQLKDAKVVSVYADSIVFKKDLTIHIVKYQDVKDDNLLVTQILLNEALFAGKEVFSVGPILNSPDYLWFYNGEKVLLFLAKEKAKGDFVAFWKILNSNLKSPVEKIFGIGEIDVEKKTFGFIEKAALKRGDKILLIDSSDKTLKASDIGVSSFYKAPPGGDTGGNGDGDTGGNSGGETGGETGGDTGGEPDFCALAQTSFTTNIGSNSGFATCMGCHGSGGTQIGGGNLINADHVNNHTRLRAAISGRGGYAGFADWITTDHSGQAAANIITKAKFSTWLTAEQQCTN